MITRNILNIYKVEHRYLKEGEYVVAKSIEDAIAKFNKFYENDIDIFLDGITSVMKLQTYEVIDESEKYE